MGGTCPFFLTALRRHHISPSMYGSWTLISTPFSSHKMFGPSGVGVLYGKEALLEAMPPYQSGGDMISSVTFEKTTYNRLPYKFEAGTPNIADVVGLGAAIDYIHVHRDGANRRTRARASGLWNQGAFRDPGTPADRSKRERKPPCSPSSWKGIHPHDIGTILDQDGIAVRTGHHCAQPVMDRFKIPATARASMALYNTKEEIDLLAAGIRKVIEVCSVDGRTSRALSGGHPGPQQEAPEPP